MLLLTPEEKHDRDMAREAKANTKLEATPPPSKEVGFVDAMRTAMAKKHPD